MSQALPVYIPLLNPNEPETSLAAVHVRPGQFVEKGELLCTLETTKSTAELFAEAAGFVIGLQATAGQSLPAGTLLCYLAEQPDFVPDTTSEFARSASTTNAAAGSMAKNATSAGAQINSISANAASPLDAGNSSATALPPNLRITQPALNLARQENLDLAQLPRDRLITESWLRAHGLPAAQPASLPELPTDIPANGIIIYGGGGHGKALIDLLRSLGEYTVLGVVDDGLPPGASVMGAPVLGGQAVLAELQRRGARLAVNAVGGIGNLSVRVKVFEQLAQAGFSCPALVHPTAFVEASASLSDGVQVFPHAYVGSEARLGFGVIVNTAAVISHDCVLGDYTNISPGALLAGEVHTGAGTLVGMGVTINLRVHIGAGARIGNSAVIKEDVPEKAVVRAGAIWPA